MSTLSYQLGYRLGTLVAQVKRGLLSSMTEQTFVFGTASHRHEDAQAQTPAMVRRGVDLNDSYDRNETICAQPSPRKRAESVRKPEPLDSLRRAITTIRSLDSDSIILSPFDHVI